MFVIIASPDCPLCYSEAIPVSYGVWLIVGVYEEVYLYLPMAAEYVWYCKNSA